MSAPTNTSNGYGGIFRLARPIVIPVRQPLAPPPGLVLGEGLCLQNNEGTTFMIDGLRTVQL